jgi:hypothetical protein
MSHTHSPSEWAAYVSLAIGIYAASLIPFLLLVDAEHLTPRWLREAPDAARTAARQSALATAVLLMILTAPEATR